MSNNIPSSRSLLALLTMDNTEMNRGRVRALIQQGRPRQMHGPTYPQVIGDFLQGFLAAMQSEDPIKATLRHPEEDARRHGPVYSDTDAELEAPDLAWLQRLPVAKDVTYADAVQLARFAAYPFGLNSSSGRFVKSLWEPVKEVYDQKVAAAVIANAQRKLFKIPNPTAAVALAIANENSFLTDRECQQRADEAVEEALAERRHIHEERLNAAKDEAQQVADRRTSRLNREVRA
jgi:hypothetical protein